MRATTTEQQAGDDVVRWRQEQLTRCGFPLPVATRPAKDARYDLHALIELVERGCPADVAVRILEPLEEATTA